MKMTLNFDLLRPETILGIRALLKADQQEFLSDPDGGQSLTEENYAEVVEGIEEQISAVDEAAAPFLEKLKV